MNVACHPSIASKNCFKDHTFVITRCFKSFKVIFTNPLSVQDNFKAGIKFQQFNLISKYLEVCITT